MVKQFKYRIMKAVKIIETVLKVVFITLIIICVTSLLVGIITGEINTDYLN